MWPVSQKSELILPLSMNRIFGHDNQQAVTQQLLLQFRKLAPDQFMKLKAEI